MAHSGEDVELRSAALQNAQSILQARRRAEEELARAREDLAQSEERFRLLSTIAPHLLWTTDAHGAADYLNDRWYDYTGQTPEDALGQGWAKALHPDEYEPTREAWQRSVTTGEPYEVEYRLRRHDGEYRWFVARGVPLRAEDGSITRWYGSCTDIHQRRLTAEALREESVINEQLLEVAKALSTELDMTKVVQIITDAGTRVSRAQFGAFFYSTMGTDGSAYMLYALSGAPKETFAHFPRPRATQIFGPTLRGEGIIRLGDVRKDSRFGHGPPYEGMPPGHVPVVSYLAVPVISRSGGVLGGLFFGHSEPDVFTERDERLVRGIAAQAASAIDTAQLYLAEQQARSAAEAASQAKDRFLAFLSHELRTPLTPVLMAAANLETSTDLPDSVKSDMAMIRRNVELEAKLIDDLLDLSRIASGKLALNVEPVNVNETVSHVYTICQASALEKGITLVSDLDPQLGWIGVDPARLQQVLWNLVSNAVKFTSAGGRVEIATRRLAGDRVQLQVSDNGMGIEPDVLPQVFDAFEQGPADVTRRFGGLGLGLAITKALVEMHQGTVMAQSAGPGTGATFTVLLPSDLPTGAPKPGTPAVPLPADVSQVRLLVVEDHVDTARTLSILLRRAGFAVVTARNVANALDLVEAQPFDMLVSDLGLPDGTGYDLMKQVHERHAIPGIAMSGYGMEEDLRKSRSAGFTEHLVKPVSVPKLIEVIRRLMARH